MLGHCCCLGWFEVGKGSAGTGRGEDVSVAIYWEESSLPVAVRRQLRGNIYLFGGSSS